MRILKRKAGSRGRRSRATEIVKRHAVQPKTYVESLQVRKHARDAAERGAGVEDLYRAIDSEYAARTGALTQDAGEALGELNQERQQLRDRFDATRLEEMVADARAALGRHRLDLRTPLEMTYRRLMKAVLRLRAFMDAEGIDRDVIRGMAPLMVVLTMTAAIVIEGFINASSFAQVMEGGFADGILQAMLLAAINVITAAGAGVAARQLSSRRTWRRAYGVTVIALYGAFLVTYTALIAHYRVALHSNPSEAASEAVMRLVHTPLAIYDFHAWVLAICCVLAAGVAFLAGLRAKDPLPGYAEVAAGKGRAERAYFEARNAYTTGIDGVTAPAWSATESSEAETQKARHAFDANLTESNALMDAYRTEMGNHQVARIHAQQEAHATYVQVAGLGTLAPWVPTNPESPGLPEDLERVLREDKAFAKGLNALLAAYRIAALNARARIRAARTEARREAEAYFGEIEAAVKASMGLTVVGTTLPLLTYQPEEVEEDDEASDQEPIARRQADRSPG